MELLNTKNVIIYLICINLLSFIAMGIDKYKAKKGYWRIPEKNLILLVILGGGIGGIFGMYLFRHKINKMQFRVGFPLILITEIVCYALFKIIN